MRLFPRFSLRFAWLALTIFLIALGISVSYWRRYEAHEKIARQFQTMNCNVEEEPITLFGFFLGKRLTGIEITPHVGNAGYRTFADVKNLDLLKQLSHPGDVRRFGITGHGLEANDLALVFATLERLPAIEEIYIDTLLFTEAQVNLLGRLPQLRILRLSNCSLQRGTLQQLDRMPNLEQLTFEHTDFDMAELLQLNLPRLRIFETDSSLTQLQFTKLGWGRFPSLETLILSNLELKSVTLEAGSMARLKQLALYGEVDAESQLDWQGFPAALPELTLLALPDWGLELEFFPSLLKLPQLKSVYIDMNPQMNGYTTVTPFTKFSPSKLEKEIPPESLPAIQKLLQQRPHFLFDVDCVGASEMLHPRGNRDLLTMPKSPGMWPSENWRVKNFLFGGVLVPM